MDEETAWRQFERTGSIEAYLVYCQTAHRSLAQTNLSLPQEETHADPHRRAGNPRKQRGRE